MTNILTHLILPPSIKTNDYQAMMVDPIFMIVQNVRSFLTAVTPTAVTPTAIILLEFSLIYLLPEYI